MVVVVIVGEGRLRDESSSALAAHEQRVDEGLVQSLEVARRNHLIQMLHCWRQLPCF